MSKRVISLLFRFRVSQIMTAYIGIDGFTLPSGFILKEMCILYPNDEYDHYLFKNRGWQLTEANRRTIRYTTKNLNNLCYEDGFIPYEQIANILDSVKDVTICTYSEIAVTILQRYLPTTVIEIHKMMGLTCLKLYLTQDAFASIANVTVQRQRLLS